jgi:hypothetical protein
MRHRRPSEARVPAQNFVHRSHFVRVGLVGERASRSGLREGVIAARSGGMASRARDAEEGREYERQEEANQHLWQKA